MLNFFRQTKGEQMTDEQLLERYVSSGDVRSLGMLYERYMPMVYGVCLKVLKDRGKAEDAVMAIYEEIARKTREHEINSFRGWLYVVARNHCLMEWRKKQRRPTDLLAPEDMARFDSPEDETQFELPQKQSSLEKCLAQLNDNQRVSVQLFYYEDQSYKEISETLRLDVGLVRSHIQNGRRNLKICLDGLRK